jgi:hypothetical protein
VKGGEGASCDIARGSGAAVGACGMSRGVDLCVQSAISQCGRIKFRPDRFWSNLPTVRWGKHDTHPAAQAPRVHKCITCGKAIASPKNLTTQIWVLTGERPFSCHPCCNASAASGAEIEGVLNNFAQTALVKERIFFHENMYSSYTARFFATL